MPSSDRRVAVVTGGSRGIGFAICERLCADGLRVVLTARTEIAAKSAADRLKADGFEVLAASGDVADEGVAERRRSGPPRHGEDSTSGSTTPPESSSVRSPMKPSNAGTGSWR